MTFDRYILNDKGEPEKLPLPPFNTENDETAPLSKLMVFWSEAMMDAKKRGLFKVGNTEVAEGVSVSTIFLFLDHNHFDEGPPILWESMVFGGPMDQEMNRCSGGREQAEAMHLEMVERVQAVLALQN